MTSLKLATINEKDLEVVSAHAQDAVTKVGDLVYRLAMHNFVVPMNRFAWETLTGFFRKRHEQWQRVLQFDRIKGAKTAGIDRSKPDDILSLLTIRFHEKEAPSGEVELLFSGGRTISLNAECIEARPADLGAA